jgi:hypothetical protein
MVIRTMTTQAVLDFLGSAVAALNIINNATLHLQPFPGSETGSGT